MHNFGMLVYIVSGVDSIVTVGGVLEAICIVEMLEIELGWQVWRTVSV